jgi:ribosomal protein S12 methylthiotransferase
MSNMPSVRLITLGCAKNEVDSEEIAGVLQRAGYRLDAHTDAPDVVVINTCGFLESAQREGMAVIRDALRLKRQGKTQRVIVAGCMVQRLGESLREQFPEVDAWVGVGQMARFAEIADAARATRQPIADIQPPHHRWADVPTRLRSRAPWTAYLKVSEGCDHKCAFCTIPSFRGRHVSKPIERVLDEARWLAHNGARELNLIAQDTTQYGYDLYKQFMLPTLLRELNAVEEIEWIRVHYAYPSRITDALIEAMASLPKVAHYLDVPLQHADRAVLQAMRRPGDGARYLQMVRRLREAMPDIAIRTTFHRGVPRRGRGGVPTAAGLSAGGAAGSGGRVYVFAREGHARRRDARPSAVPRQARAVRPPDALPAADFVGAQPPVGGQTMRVLIEGYSADGKHAIGRSHRDAPDVDGLVYVRGCTASPGEFVQVRITDADVYDVWGEAIPEPHASRRKGG